MNESQRTVRIVLETEINKRKRLERIHESPLGAFCAFGYTGNLSMPLREKTDDFV